LRGNGTESLVLNEVEIAYQGRILETARCPVRECGIKCSSPSRSSGCLSAERQPALPSVHAWRLPSKDKLDNDREDNQRYDDDNE